MSYEIESAALNVPPSQQKKCQFLFLFFIFKANFEHIWRDSQYLLVIIFSSFVQVFAYWLL